MGQAYQSDRTLEQFERARKPFMAGRLVDFAGDSKLLYDTFEVGVT